MTDFLEGLDKKYTTSPYLDEQKTSEKEPEKTPASVLLKGTSHENEPSLTASSYSEAMAGKEIYHKTTVDLYVTPGGGPALQDTHEETLYISGTKVTKDSTQRIVEDQKMTTKEGTLIPIETITTRTIEKPETTYKKTEDVVQKSLDNMAKSALVAGGLGLLSTVPVVGPIASVVGFGFMAKSAWDVGYYGYGKMFSDIKTTIAAGKDVTVSFDKEAFYEKGIPYLAGVVGGIVGGFAGYQIGMSRYYVDTGDIYSIGRVLESNKETIKGEYSAFQPYEIKWKGFFGKSKVIKTGISSITDVPFIAKSSKTFLKQTLQIL